MFHVYSYLYCDCLAVVFRSHPLHFILRYFQFSPLCCCTKFNYEVSFVNLDWACCLMYFACVLLCLSMVGGFQSHLSIQQRRDQRHSSRRWRPSLKRWCLETRVLQRKWCNVTAESCKVMLYCTFHNKSLETLSRCCGMVWAPVHSTFLTHKRRLGLMQHPT